MRYRAIRWFALLGQMLVSLSVVLALNHNPYFDVNNLVISGSNLVLVPSSTGSVDSTDIDIRYRESIPDIGKTELSWNGTSQLINIYEGGSSLSIPKTWSDGDQGIKSLELKAQASSTPGNTATLNVTYTGEDGSTNSDSKDFDLVKVHIDQADLARTWIGEGQMPDGLALNEKRDLTVTIEPSTLPGGASVVFFPSDANNRGGVSIVGNDTLSSSGTITIKGDSLTDPYQGGKMRIHARIGSISGPTAYSTNGFSVTVLPVNWDELHGSTVDFAVTLSADWESETGFTASAIDDLSEVLFREIVINDPQRPNPPFTSLGAVTGPPAGQTMDVPLVSDEFQYHPDNIDPTTSGTTISTQRYEIKDLRSSINPQWILLYETELKYDFSQDSEGTWQLSFERKSDYGDINEGPWTDSQWTE